MEVKEKSQLNVNFVQVDVLVGDKVQNQSNSDIQELTAKDFKTFSENPLKSVSEALGTVKKIREQLKQKTSDQKNRMMGSLSTRRAFSFLA